MTFKPRLWLPIAAALSGINLVSAGFAAAAAEPWHATAHAAFALAFGLWAQHLGRGRGGSDLAGIQQQLEQHATALEDAQATLANQATELAELQERVDFTERLLAQARDRPPLALPEERG
jgi:hypothetical protein